MRFRFAPGRPAAVAGEAMVATSQPLATRAGIRILERGGNAVDAAISAAAVLCVAEPMSTGIGGDAFAILWRDGALHGLDAAGPAPASAEPTTDVAERGPRSVTVPGAVAGWAVLSERFGRLALDTCLEDAVRVAREGVAVAPITASHWKDEGGPAEFNPTPKVGEIFRLPELGETLEGIARDGPAAFYEGEVARAITAASWLEQDDLSSFQPRWVEPLTLDYRGTTVCELPPPGQGAAVLVGLGLLELGEPTLANQVECVDLALEDAFAHIRDGADVGWLLERERLEARRNDRARRVTEPAGGTVCLCAVDGDGLAVSFIQSIFYGFGSGVVAPGTGVVLQNRGACFAVNGAVEPGRRPYHTIIPGMLIRNGKLLGPFGNMGGFIQAQAHVQLVSGLVDDGLDPQEALDRARFRIDEGTVHLEEGLWERAGELEALGYTTEKSDEIRPFGGGQIILVQDDVLLGGSDPRKDGYAAGF